MFGYPTKNTLTSRLWLLLFVWISESVGTKTRSIQEVLVSVEEKLRGLDNLGHTMRFSGLHYGMDQMSRRMDAIEARLSQMETKLNLRLDKINEVAIVRDRVKMEHIVHKIEASNERTAAILKAHSDVRSEDARECRRHLERMEQMMKDMSSVEVEKQNREATIGKTETIIKYEDKNGNKKELPEKLKRSESPRTIETLPSGNMELADTVVATHDNVDHSEEEGQKQERDSFGGGVGEVETFTRKVMNTYQELLKESKAIDASLKEVIQRTNRTRVTIAEGFRKLHNHQTKSASTTEELLLTTLKKVLEMSATVDSSFASLLVAQNTFITTCHWVQQHQQSLPIEFRIRHILEGIVDDFRNRTITTTTTSSCDEKGVAQLKKSFESHETDVGRALRDLVWTVIEVGNQTVRDVTRQMCSDDKHKNELTTSNHETTRTYLEKGNTTESSDDF